MARPKKDNADYFSHDADMRNDVKVKALRRRFSHKGYAVWCFILETLTNEDFFEVDYTPLNRELLAADFDVTVDELQQIVDYCCTLNLLQVNCETERLFSEAHQRRFDDMLARREKRSEAGRKGMASRWGKKPDNNVITEVSSVITEDNKEKEKKVKKTKGKNTKTYPFDKIVELWNATCLSLPKVSKLSDNRRNKIKCRLDEFGSDEQVWLATAEALFETVQASDFLCGRNNSTWRASFDWVFENSSNWVKIMEGNYKNKDVQQSRQMTDGRGRLGVGEYLEKSGRRTYGSGKVTIPQDAPPRPSERYAWSNEQNNWILL